MKTPTTITLTEQERAALNLVITTPWTVAHALYPADDLGDDERRKRLAESLINLRPRIAPEIWK